jgi:acetolactate synthase I/II/III large subunit
LTRSPMARLHVRGHISTLFTHLLERLKKARTGPAPVSPIDRRTKGSGGPITKKERATLHFHLDETSKYYSDAMPIKPQRLMRELGQIFPPNTCFLADNGNSVAWAIHYLHPSDRRLAGQRPWHAGTFHVSLEFASMGWAIGAAVGTALSFLGNPVVCITGDGSLLMSGQEITVAVQEKLPVIFVILNDAALGMVKHGQRLAGAELIGFEFPEIDYCAYAKAMGAAGYIIRSPQDLLDLDVGGICKRGGPTLLDVRIDREEVPPIRSRIRALMQSNEY